MNYDDYGHATKQSAPGKPLDENDTHYKKLKNSQYLGQWDIPEGSRLTLKIIDIQKEVEVFNPLKREKNLVTTAQFQGAKKLMILGAENMDAIASHYGEDPHNWINQTIVLYVGPASNGKIGVRIEPKSNTLKRAKSSEVYDPTKA